MPEMPQRVRHDSDEPVVILGPCPGCDAWQLDYSYSAAQTYCVLRRDEPDEFSWSSHLRVDSAPFYAVVEEILQEHLAECPHLQDLLEES
jgi:hypothetical protein